MQDRAEIIWNTYERLRRDVLLGDRCSAVCNGTLIAFAEAVGAPRTATIRWHRRRRCVSWATIRSPWSTAPSSARRRLEREEDNVMALGKEKPGKATNPERATSR